MDEIRIRRIHNTCDAYERVQCMSIVSLFVYVCDVNTATHALCNHKLITRDTHATAHKSGKILFNQRIHRLVAVKMKRHSLLVS